jgi:ADP-heptose:LPS heptosyltransferase
MPVAALSGNIRRHMKLFSFAAMPVPHLTGHPEYPLFLCIFDALNPETLKKILVIRFSSIGDIILTTPVLRSLKKQYPDSEIHFLLKEKYRRVIGANPYVDHIHGLENKLAPLLRELKAARFDFVIDLHKNIRSIRVRMALGKPSASFRKLNIQKWLLVNFKVNRLPDMHIVDRYFEAGRKLGISNDGRGLDYFIPPGDRLSRDDLPATHKNAFIAFVIGGMHYTKIFPAEKVVALCRLLHLPVVLLGGEEDRERAEQITDLCGQKVYNACGLYNINQSASLLDMAAKVVTNDTGLMHIAAALQKPLISIWGNTVPEFGMYPYLPGKKELSDIVEIKGLPCRPCSKIGYGNCPKKHFRCMMDIEVEKLASVINA